MDKKLEDSAPWPHCQDYHQDEIQDNETHVIRTHNTPFNKQVTESVLIQTNQCTHPMNRKTEYNGSSIPKILIEVNMEITGEKRKTYPYIDITNNLGGNKNTNVKVLPLK